MTKILTLVLGSTALMGVSMMEPAQAEPDYAYAATGFVGGGGSWLEFDGCQGPSCENDIATIVGGGDIVLPLNGYWNVQLGGAFHIDHQHFFFGKSESAIQFQGGAIGFWRDPAMGVFGIEAGVFSPFGKNSIREGSSGGIHTSVKVGGVAEYFFSDMITFGAFGGALIPMEPHPFSGPGKGATTEFNTGFYAGGHLTYYASDTLAFAGYTRFTELNESYDPENISFRQRSFNLGGKVRYLTSMPGIEVYASGSYHKCEYELTRSGSTRANFEDGAQFMGGVKIRLGGHTGSLVGIDRSNAIDTRAWICGGGAAQEPSDRRLKTDIASLGETDDGIKLYSWKYLNDPVNTWVGVMAQDLETSHPEALVTGDDGFYRVNYSTLGVQMMTLDQWNARQL